MRPDPQFFMMGAVRADEGELYVADYSEYPEPGTQFMRKLLEIMEQEPEKLGSYIDENKSKAYAKAKVLISGKARAWPSVIGPDCSHPPLIVHQDVAEVLNTQGFTGFSLREVHIRWFFPLQLLLSKRPRYFALETERRIDYFSKLYEQKDGDYIFRYETRDFSDPELKKIQREDGRFTHRRIPIPESWDGSDFFHLDGREGMFGQLGCSRKFLDLVHQSGWTGFTFYPLDAMNSDSCEDYRLRPWPPSLWYPKGHPE